MFAQHGCMIGIGQIGDVGWQQGGVEIIPQIGDISGCVNDEAAPVEPDDDITGRFFDQAVQHAAFHFTQTNFHTDSAPAVQRKIRQLAVSQIYLVTNAIY